MSQLQAYVVSTGSSTLCRLWYVEPVVQLREYSPYLVAEVTVESDNLREALRSGFKQVWGDALECRLAPPGTFASTALCTGGWLHFWRQCVC